MSGKQKLARATRNNRLIAFPSKKVERPVCDGNGVVKRDRDGKAMTETIQLYRIRPLR